MADEKRRGAEGKPDRKPHAGAAHRGTERPDGKPQPSGGASHQPADVEGENPYAPELQPGHDPNDEAAHKRR